MTANKSAKEITYYELDTIDASKVSSLCSEAFKAIEDVTVDTAWENGLRTILTLSAVKELLIHISRLPVFSRTMAKAFKHDLSVLGILKKLKYWYVMPQSSFLLDFRDLSIALKSNVSPTLAALAEQALDDGKENSGHMRDLVKDQDGMVEYVENAEELEYIDPHAVYPTSVFRSCDGHVLVNEDASVIESVMSTTITSTIKILKGVLDPANVTLRDLYRPLGRCVMIVDAHVDMLYGRELDAYFSHHKITAKKLVFRGMEADKGMNTVESILKSLKEEGVSRNEPVLVIGGGVIADVGGFATALYHRNTPYVMLCTSIVSGIDAGPSPRTCCDGFGYKNIYGAYHPPVLTLTDRTFFKTLRTGWLRHGIAEIVKMACVKDLSLFELLEQAGTELIRTKFGTSNEVDESFGKLCDLIVGKAMEGYVKCEYGNLWETHQCRPHAFGHTWSPGYEIPAGMLHGHAVGTGMGFGAYLASVRGYISSAQCHRIMSLISSLELSLWHHIMDDKDIVWASQVKMTQKRGGHLCAPVPKGDIGKCGYINDLPREELCVRLDEYKELCKAFPREGRGIEPQCSDVGLEDPSTVGTHDPQEEGAEMKQLRKELEETKLELAENKMRLTKLQGA